MGNWHCISSACAEVHYREYLPPVVRWRYSGENWQEIEADDYESNPESGQCFANYQAYGTYTSQSNRISRHLCGQTAYWATSNPLIPGKIISSEAISNTAQIKFTSKDINGNISEHIRTCYYAFSLGSSASGSTISYQDTCVDHIIRAGNNFKVVGYKNIDNPEDNCGDCTFTVFKDGQIVHQETRDVCPEVEKLDCRLSDTNKVIKIEKLPYLERVEVVNYAYQNFGGGVYQAKIPDECLNIYNNTTATIIPLFESFPTPTNTAQTVYGYITQICSSPGCPPPEYQVICDCDSCESCPEGTCPIECEGHICCYEGDGKSRKSIPFENYCG